MELDKKQSRKWDGSRLPISVSSEFGCALNSFGGFEGFIEEERERFNSVEAT